jgi:hypothetical protein
MGRVKGRAGLDGDSKPGRFSENLQANEMMPSRIPINFRSALGLVLLIGAGLLGNYFQVTLLFGVDFLFGSIAVMLVL